jgi:2'-5' RNA ligase
MDVRLFIAINPEPATKLEISGATASLREILPEARWVPHELLHLTVKFLGEQTARVADEVALLLDRIAGSYQAIPYAIQGIGAFPNLRRPAVVWIGVRGDPKLELINHDVEQACEQVGVPVDGRAFRPHITLARIRAGRPEAVRALVSACEGIDYQCHSWVHSLDLMMSGHTDGRLAYSLVHRATLGTR